MMEINADNELKSILQTLEMAVKYEIPAESQFDQSKELAFKICKADIELKNKMHGLEIAKREETVEEFERSIEANTKEITKASVTQCVRYKTFLSDLAELKERHSTLLNRSNMNSSVNRRSMGDSNDQAAENSIIKCADGIEMDMQISDIDPLTKQLLEKPCRNKYCGHIYGLDSVTQTLQANPRLRCPIVGCANKNLVKISDLVLDKELARKLHNQRANNRKN